MKKDILKDSETQHMIHSYFQAGVSLWEIFCWSQKHFGLEHDAGTGICSRICSCPPEFLNAGLIIYWVTSKQQIKQLIFSYFLWWSTLPVDSSSFWQQFCWMKMFEVNCSHHWLQADLLLSQQSRVCWASRVQLNQIKMLTFG